MPSYHEPTVLLHIRLGTCSASHSALPHLVGCSAYRHHGYRLGVAGSGVVKVWLCVGPTCTGYWSGAQAAVAGCVTGFAARQYALTGYGVHC